MRRDPREIRRAAPRRFCFLDHTGDAAAAIYGRSLEELFTNAAEALCEILTERRKIQEKEARAISIEQPTLEMLLVAWLNEFLYLFDAKGLLFRRFEISHLDTGRLEARAWGEQYDEGRHSIKTQIKAATYHQLEIRKERNRWKARIVFDV